MKILLAYVPVLHQGYWEFFVRDHLAGTIYIFGADLISKFDSLRKDIRALPPTLVWKAIRSWGISKFKEVHVANEATLQVFNSRKDQIAMPDEDVSREAASQYLGDCEIEFVPVFLRWDKQSVLKEKKVHCDKVISADEFSARVMNLALTEAQKSSDWWRQVGAAVVKNGEVLFTAFNRHVPSPNHVWVFGDPRANFRKGVHFELSPALHAEAAAVSWAASKSDVSLAGADLYVTTFPCPPCARIIAYSGIKKLFFLEGYAVYDGIDVLRAKGVEIIRVRM